MRRFCSRVEISLLDPSDQENYNDEKLLVTLVNTKGEIVKQLSVPFSKARLMLSLPAADLYTISISQFLQTGIQLKGKLIPLLTYEQMKRAEEMQNLKKNMEVTIMDSIQKQNFYYVLPK